MRYLLIGVILLFPACSSGFIKEGATYQEFYSELRRCEAETAPKWSFCVGHACRVQSSELKKRRNQCMQAHGWRLSREEDAFHP